MAGYSMIRSARVLIAAFALAVPPLAVVPARAAPPAEAAVVRTDADRVLVTWRSAGPVDVLVADRADASVQRARVVASRDGDGRATVAASAGQRRYILLRDVRSGDVARVAERVVPLAAGSNFRDIGGYPAAGGRHVRWGLIYRSGATPLLTEGDRAAITALGLRNMIDLRSDEERVLAPTRIDGVPYAAVGYSMATMMGNSGGITNGEGIYRRLPTLIAPQLRLVFARLLRAEGPLVYNCSAGQDRTGFATAMILSALGTPYPVVVADYHLSTKFRRPEFEMPRFDAATMAANPVAAMFGRFQDDPRMRVAQPLMTAEGKPFLDFAFAEVKDRWGGVDGYLRRELKLTTADIARLRALYTR